MRKFWGTLNSDRRKTTVGTGGNTTNFDLAVLTERGSTTAVSVAGWSYSEPIEGYKTKTNEYSYYKTSVLLDWDHMLETTVTLLNKEFHSSTCYIVEVSTGTVREFNPMEVPQIKKYRD